MPRIERTRDIVWEGNVARGDGTITAAHGRVHRRSRSRCRARIGQAQGKTSPEELLAAAHGGCLTMSIADRADPGRHAARAPRGDRAGS